ncbi:hypothetical protein AN958_04619 [Leucoagaricus sp. SymC.cos]|nr:hypothetical protein AN958_04619 [Leucoagaricus sp. SymC.cos]
MSQRLLIHLHDASRERRQESEGTAYVYTITSDILSPQEVSEVLRTQLTRTHKRSRSDSIPYQHEIRQPVDLEVADDQVFPEHVDVHVRVERTVKVERVPHTIQLEDYSRRARKLPGRNVQTRH